MTRLGKAALQTLSQRRLQRIVLTRQQLLERSADSLPDVLARVAGLQSQYAPTMYVGLWSRVEGFARDDLTGALENRSVVQGTMVRSTIHLVAAVDYWPINVAIRGIRQAWYLRLNESSTHESVIVAADLVRSALRECGTLTRKEIDAIAGQGAGSYIGLWLDLVRVPPSGTWERRRADLFALAESWVGPQPEFGVDDALDQLVRHYLTGFGPASVNEIASFCGMNVRDIKPAAERVTDRRFLAEDGTELLDLDGLPLADEDTPAPVRFIGNWEALLLVHARRSRLVLEEDRPRIFGIKMPQSLPTFLVDGQVTGTWKHVDGRIVLDEWRPIPVSLRRELDDEAERLAQFHR